MINVMSNYKVEKEIFTGRFWLTLQQRAYITFLKIFVTTFQQRSCG
jgi:hypothetical protein